jgi:mRNA interferase RelE/StbE
VANYEIQFAASAAKEFRSLGMEIKRRIGLAVDALAQNPRPSGVRKLKGHERLYRIRVGDYRLVYEINDSVRLIRVTKIRHRREAYQ